MNAPNDFRAMDLGHEYDDNDGGGMEDQAAGDVIEGDALAIEHQPLQEELDQAYDDGYEAAADGKPESDCPQMAGPLCIQWVKGWKDWHEQNGEGSGNASADEG
jgi:ribosome modulation factor